MSLSPPFWAARVSLPTRMCLVTALDGLFLEPENGKIGAARHGDLLSATLAFGGGGFGFRGRGRLGAGVAGDGEADAEILNRDLGDGPRLRNSHRPKQRAHVDLVHDEQLWRGIDRPNEVGDLIDLAADFHLNGDFGERSNRLRIEHSRGDDLRASFDG